MSVETHATTGLSAIESTVGLYCGGQRAGDGFAFHGRFDECSAKIWGVIVKEYQLAVRRFKFT
eukprot:1479019-Prorocentrum_lima.AAC.1